MLMCCSIRSLLRCKHIYSTLQWWAWWPSRKVQMVLPSSSTSFETMLWIQRGRCPHFFVRVVGLLSSISWMWSQNWWGYMIMLETMSVVAGIWNDSWEVLTICGVITMKEFYDKLRVKKLQSWEIHFLEEVLHMWEWKMWKTRRGVE